MSPSAATPKYGTWKAPQCPFVIEYDIEVLARINREVIEGYRALPHGGLEVGGLLLGVERGDKVLIRGAEPLECRHAAGPGFILSADDLRLLSDRLGYYQALGDGDTKVVGWYHSHTRSGISLTAEDAAIHEKYFPGPKQIALVVRPQASGSSLAGFFFREEGVMLKLDKSRLEFAINSAESEPVIPVAPPPLRSSSRKKAREAPVVEPDGIAFTPEVRKEDKHIEVRRAANAATIIEVQPPGQAKNRIGVWLVLAAMFVLALSAVFYLRSYSGSAKPKPAGFVRVEAIKREGNLEVRWDPASIAGAREGELDVQDGAIRAKLLLDQKTLESGSLSYAYKSDVTGFHLRVNRADGTVVEGSTTYVGGSGAVERASVDLVSQPDQPAEQQAEEAKPPVEEAERTKPPVRVFEAPRNQPGPASATAGPTIVDAPPPVTVAQNTPAGVVPLAQAPAPLPAPPPSPKPPAQPAPTSAAVAQKPVAKPLELAGKWSLQPGMASRAPGTPELFAITMTEKDGVVQGSLEARYKTAGKTDRVTMSFAGRIAGGSARCAWIGRDGQRGEMEFIRVPNSDLVEVVWVRPDSKQVFDHVVKRVQ